MDWGAPSEETSYLGLETDPGTGVRTGIVAGAGVVAIGFVLLVTAFLSWYWLDVEPFNAFVIAIPPAFLVAVMVAIHRSTVPEALYTVVFRGALTGGVVVSVFILLVLVVQGDSIVGGLPLIVFMAGFGTVSGVLVGAARSQELRAQRQAEILARQREQLEFLNQLLRHNVLNKIAIIKGNAELISEEHTFDEPYPDRIRAQSEDVEELITNVRVLVSTFTSDTRLQPVDLSAELRKELHSLENSYDPIDIDAEIPDAVTVYADDLLRYTFENILHNAVEHNDEAIPHVEVRVEEDTDEVRVTITDNGPGVPEGLLDGIADGELHANHGVGLYLVDTLLEQYGGTMAIETVESGGTDVELSFQPAGGEASR